MHGEDACINPNLMRREDELAVYFTLWVSSIISTFLYDCCLWTRNMFSIVTTSHTVTVSYRQSPLYDIIKQHMDISLRKPNSIRISGTDIFVDDALSAKDAQ